MLPENGSTSLKFGPFLVDLRSGELRRNGVRIRLQEKPLRVLELLTSRQGEMVGRDELKKHLWPDETFVDYENGLNIAVGKLRSALSDDPDNPRYIETIPRRGYRFLALVEGQTNGSSIGHGAAPAVSAPVGLAKPQTIASQPVVPAVARGKFYTAGWFRALAACNIAALAIIVWWLTPLPAPRLENTLSLTNNGRQDFMVRPATDGTRLFYVQRSGDHYDLMQVALSGGEPQKLPAPFRNSLIWDVTPDGSKYLLTSFARRGEPSPLWSWPTTGGEPVKLGDLVSGSAAWSPDGKALVLHEGHTLSVANADGSSTRVLGTFAEEPDNPVWSPDGQRVRFTLNDPDRDLHTLWEIRNDGSGLHKLLRDWPNHSRVCCGTWSGDGRYYLFVELREPRSRLWAIREQGSWWRRSPSGPFLLASEPTGSLSPLVGRDGKHVYFYGAGLVVNLHRLDQLSGQLTPFLSEAQAALPTFSPDGKWMAYVQLSQGALQIVRTNGEASHQLVEPSLLISTPRLSPDSRTIAFAGQRIGEVWNIYFVPIDGGPVAPLRSDLTGLKDPDWSPDGQSLVATRVFRDSANTERSSLVFVNLKTHLSESLPGSEGFYAPRWSPDGRFIAAVSEPNQALELYDTRTRNWTAAAKGGFIGLPAWSPDAKFVYFQDLIAFGEPLFRLNVQSGKVEQVADFEKILAGGVHKCAFLTLTAAGDPVVAFQRSVSDIYVASLYLP